MAACCSGSLVEALMEPFPPPKGHKPKPHVCWSVPVKEPTEADKRRWKLFDVMARVDSLDDSTLVCKCGGRFTWGSNDRGLDGWMDSHLKCYGL